MKLEVESVMEDACKRTGLQDFRDDRFLEPLGVLLQALRDEAPLSAVGRLVSRHFIVQMLNRGGQRHREPLAGGYPLSRSSASR